MTWYILLTSRKTMIGTVLTDVTLFVPTVCYLTLTPLT